MILKPSSEETILLIVLVVVKVVFLAAAGVDMDANCGAEPQVAQKPMLATFARFAKIRIPITGPVCAHSCREGTAAGRVQLPPVALAPDAKSRRHPRNMFALPRLPWLRMAFTMCNPSTS